MCTETVQSFYGVGNTDDDIVNLLRSLHAELKSWRKVGELPILNQIKFGTHNAYAKPNPRKIVNPEHRMIYGLPVLIETEPCPTCGKAHNHNCGEERVTKKPGTLKKRNRLSINLDSVESSANSIYGNTRYDNPDFCKNLAMELLKKG